MSMDYARNILMVKKCRTCQYYCRHMEVVTVTPEGEFIRGPSWMCSAPEAAEHQPARWKKDGAVMLGKVVWSCNLRWWKQRE